MKEFELTASIAPSKKNRKSGFSKMAGAIMRMLGGMVPDGQHFRVDGTDFGLAFAQLMFTESDIDLFVMGASYSVDEKSTFVAMTDGSIWKVRIWAENKKLRAVGVKVKEEADRDCTQVIAMQGAVKQLALVALINEGAATADDSFSGHVVVDAHSAICMKPYGYGVLLISAPDGTDKGGYKFAIDAARNVPMEEAITKLNIMPMEPSEIADYKKKQMEAATQTVEGSPFPQKVGLA